VGRWRLPGRLPRLEAGGSVEAGPGPVGRDSGVPRPRCSLLGAVRDARGAVVGGEGAHSGPGRFLPGDGALSSGTLLPRRSYFCLVFLVKRLFRACAGVGGDHGARGHGGFETAGQITGADL